MKKIIVFLFCLLLLLSSFSFNKINIVSAEVDLVISAPSAGLIAPGSKRSLYEKNKDKKLYPASMTKMMGLSLVLEEINKGNASFNDEVIASSYASSMGGTQIYLEEGEKMCLEDLFKAVAINSANDAIVALLEHLYGSREGFLNKMNAKAKELGMNNTNFNNATGFDDENHYTTSYDMALLGSHLVSFKEDILKYTSLNEAYIRENSSSPFWLVNTNKLLKYYDGMDGLKTGYTSKAGYNLTATACRNGVRLISVVMNEDSIASRSKDTTTLLNHGFSLLKCERLYNANDIIKCVKVTDYQDKESNIYVKDNVDVILYKKEDRKDLQINLYLDELTLPLIKDQKVGYIKILSPSGYEFIYDVYIDDNVDNVSFIDIFLSYLKMFFS